MKAKISPYAFTGKFGDSLNGYLPASRPVIEIEADFTLRSSPIWITQTVREPERRREAKPDYRLYYLQPIPTP
jgi:hypothetical protein